MLSLRRSFSDYNNHLLDLTETGQKTLLVISKNVDQNKLKAANDTVIAVEPKGKSVKS